MRWQAVVVGGTALALLGIVSRQTRDVDVLVPSIPEEIARAARAFAFAQRLAGIELADDWLNEGPAALAQVLPDGW